MGRQSSAKKQSSGTTTEPPAKSGLNPLLLAAIVVAVIGVGVFAFMRGDSPTKPTAASGKDAASQSPKTAKGDEPTAEAIAVAAAARPHKQSSLPPVPFAAYAPPRPAEVVTADYHFAAEHPEVLSYVPCFCGCQQGGHRGNADCFVKSRAANGDVLEWEPHGVECAVCIDVATRSRQMHASGASVKDIRAAIEKEFAPNFTTMTPTPKPPAGAEESHDH
jgi:Protein of unknown function with PCYCGC motif